uniref:Battenin n=1 Tax=Panagrolaimus sp. PS1159 TaxID=55785 RepID=A0AC35G0B8_9BILA
MSLLNYTIPVILVYFAQYFINQGLTPLIYFDCSHGFNLSKASQYRWFQVLYQSGTFISRSRIIGGLSYVNSLHRMHQVISPDIREFALSTAGASRTLGIVMSGVIAIPIRNYICARQHSSINEF